jgi:hypothetical protein
MNSKKLRRLSALLPAVIMMTGSITKVAALELDALDYSAQLADAVEGADYAVAEGILNDLRACGVVALELNGTIVPLIEIDAGLEALRSGQAGYSLPSTSAASFVVGSLTTPSVNCDIVVRPSGETVSGGLSSQSTSSGA